MSKIVIPEHMIRIMRRTAATAAGTSEPARSFGALGPGGIMGGVGTPPFPAAVAAVLVDTSLIARPKFNRGLTSLCSSPMRAPSCFTSVMHEPAEADSPWYKPEWLHEKAEER